MPPGTPDPFPHATAFDRVCRLAAGWLCLALSACLPALSYASPPLTETAEYRVTAAPEISPSETAKPRRAKTPKRRPTASPSPTITEIAQPPSPTNTQVKSAVSPDNYRVQSGDTLRALAARFRVRLQDISSPQPLAAGFLAPGQELVIRHRPQNGAAGGLGARLLPDSEVVYSASAAGFDVPAFVQAAGGYLSMDDEYLRSSGATPGSQVVARIALENSVNPRLLLALLDYQCGCLVQELDPSIAPEYLLNLRDPMRVGLYRQLGWAANQLSLGYFGWRDGWFTQLYFPSGVTVQLPPDLNAGTAALAFLFAKLYDYPAWQQALDPASGFPARYVELFGDPWARAQVVEPLIPGGLEQPPFTLPFLPGQVWSFSSGPHKAWETEGALAALDFAPKSEVSGCVSSEAWVVALADGLVVRSEFGAVVQDLDDDGLEQTGWDVLYMHIEARDRVAVGVYLHTGDKIGHPSCEGGPSSGTHLHLARKYNGEWMAAGGPAPFVMDGWTVQAGYKPYEGSLSRGGVTIVANPWGTSKTLIQRDK